MRFASFKRLDRDFANKWWLKATSLLVQALIFESVCSVHLLFRQPVRHESALNVNRNRLMGFISSQLHAV